jgi:soluble lytic murein transglycosylase-like protein
VRALPVLLSLASLGGAALYLESVDPSKGARGPIAGGALGDRYNSTDTGTMGCKGPKDSALLKTLADKWCAKFSGVTADWVMAIGQIESGQRPSCATLYGRDLLRGGAWGFLQQTYATALGNIRALQSSTDADVQSTLTNWHGTPMDLQNPDLNVMLGVYHLSILSKKYDGDFSTVAAAYNQGTGNIEKAMANGGIPDGLTAHGQLYVEKANAAKAANA